jgi:hypothetical protein
MAKERDGKEMIDEIMMAFNGWGGVIWIASIGIILIIYCLILLKEGKRGVKQCQR